MAVWITGIGWASSIGYNTAGVLESLAQARTGITLARWPEGMGGPVKLWAPVMGFDAQSEDQEDWKAPEESFRLPMEILRSIPPSGYYAFWSVAQALAQAGLKKEEFQNAQSGLYTASAGSTRSLYRHLGRLYEKGAMGCSPMGVISSVVGTLNFNLGAYLGIRGHSCGFASACASSGHALGMAFDALESGAQERFVVVGAEDDTPETILPFASMRVLTSAATPDEFRGPFDAKRSGFVGTGGAVAMILENDKVAQERGASPLAILRGWGQATDGYHPAKPHPEGMGLLEACKQALTRAGVGPQQIDYVNAHATGTVVGDLAEMKVLKTLFGPKTAVSSTKGLTGHGLSLASILELGLTVLALKEGFLPGSAALKELDCAAGGVSYLKENTPAGSARLAMSNSSGFGGANVSLVVEKV